MATILIATGDHRFSRVLSGMLASYGHDVVLASTEEATLQLSETTQTAVVLLDLGLPGLRGLEGLAMIRARCPRLPIVVLADGATHAEESRVRELGVLAFLRKQLKLNVIMQVVTHALQHAGPSPQTKPVSGLPRQAKILIVDDEPEICVMLKEFLTRRGYLIQTAASGEQALAMIQREPPDLVLLDVYMPGMNGVEVLRRVRETPASPGVIMLSASQDSALLQAARDLGALDVLSKPVDLKELELAVMARLMLDASA